MNVTKVRNFKLFAYGVFLVIFINIFAASVCRVAGNQVILQNLIRLKSLKEPIIFQYNYKHNALITKYLLRRDISTLLFPF